LLCSKKTLSEYYLSSGLICVYLAEADLPFLSSLPTRNRNAIQAAYPIENGSSISGALLEGFREIIAEFKEQQVQSAKKSRSNASSEVASLLEKQKCYTFIQSLVPSSATLLVIPRNLMDHWQAS
jgi:hypothetical protein